MHMVEVVMLYWRQPGVYYPLRHLVLCKQICIDL